MKLKKIIKKNFPNETAFTLIEILVAVSIFAIVITIALIVFLTMVKSNNKARILNKVRNDGSRVMDEIERSLKLADTIGDLTNGQNVYFRRNGNEYYRYEIIPGVAGISNGNIIKYYNCDSVWNCADSYDLTPTDENEGLSVSADSRFVFSEVDKQIKIILVFNEPYGLDGKTDYQVEVKLESTIVLRNY